MTDSVFRIVAIERSRRVTASPVGSWVWRDCPSSSIVD
jgi:hypothetical protein